MSLPGGSILILRPGALGDAVLTLPALHALAQGLQRPLVVLGNPASWAFVRREAKGIPLRMADSGSVEWLGLFAPGARLGPSARALLAETHAAIVYLGSGCEVTVRALRQAGVKEVLAIDPPKGGDRIKPAQPPRARLGSRTLPEPGHAARRLLDPLLRRWPELSKGASVRQADFSGGIRPLEAPGLQELQGLQGPQGHPGLLGPLGQAHDPLLAVSDAEIRTALRRLGLEPISAGRTTERGHLGRPPWCGLEARAPTAYRNRPLDGAPAQGLLALHPGSGGAKKCWPAGRFAELARDFQHRYGLAPLVFLGPADAPARKAFESAAPSGMAWHVADGFPLREVLALLSVCCAYVGNDSGLTHLAARCCPTLALFGPTDPRIWRPLGERVTVLRSRTREMARLPVPTAAAALAAILNRCSAP